MPGLKIGSLVNYAVEIGDTPVLCRVVEADMNELVKIATDITEKDGGVDVVIIGNSEGKIVGASSKNAMGKGVKVNLIIKESAAILGGGGGGRPNLAQGAGPNFDKIQEALRICINQN